MKKLIQFTLLLSSLLLTAACFSSSSDSKSTPAGTTGTLSVGATDAPIDDADAINIIFTKIEIQKKDASGESGWLTYFESATGSAIDLLQFRNGKESPFGSKEIEVGDYGQVRIFLKDTGNTITLKGTTTPAALLYNKGIANTGLKLTGGFKIEAGKTTKLTIDFDVRKSIVNKGGKKGGYYLKPTIRLVATDTSGKITVKATTVGAIYYIYKANTDITSESALTTAVTDESGNVTQEPSPFANAISSSISFADTNDNNTLKSIFAFLPFDSYDIYSYDDSLATKLLLVKSGVVLSSTASSIIIP